MTNADLGKRVLVRLIDDEADVFGIVLTGTLTGVLNGLAKVTFHSGDIIGVPVRLVEVAA